MQCRVHRVESNACGELNCIPEFQSSIGYIIEEPGFVPEVTRPFSLFLGWGLETRLGVRVSGGDGSVGGGSVGGGSIGGGSVNWWW